uniref:Uncharacterized protein LOC100378837 n=1 Tax=Saccoglossus kowalevskii TaxID=10224 RepID=A0ABM0MSL9_SACKO|nr:PREDICTED: uncharacterized protein LOC100378837 [Saccoglossus kowalevskii]
MPRRSNAYTQYRQYEQNKSKISIQSYTYFIQAGKSDNTEPEQQSLGNAVPVFTQQLVDLDVSEGDQVELVCRICGNSDINWYHNGNMITSKNTQYKILQRGDQCVLHIDSATGEHDGEYMCEASNENGETVCYAELTVDFKEPRDIISELVKHKPLVSEQRKQPVFSQLLSDCNVITGGRAVFECQVRGKPKPSIYWYRNDHLLKESEKITIDENENGLCRLIVADVCEEDAAEYTCEAVNEDGDAVCYAQLKLQPTVPLDMDDWSPLPCKGIFIDIQLNQSTDAISDICIEKPRYQPITVSTKHNHLDFGKLSQSSDSVTDTCMETPRKQPVTKHTHQNHLNFGTLSHSTDNCVGVPRKQPITMPTNHNHLEISKLCQSTGYITDIYIEKPSKQPITVPTYHNHLDFGKLSQSTESVTSICIEKHTKQSLTTCTDHNHLDIGKHGQSTGSVTDIYTEKPRKHLETMHTNHNHLDFGKLSQSTDFITTICIEKPRKQPVTMHTQHNHLDIGKLSQSTDSVTDIYREKAGKLPIKMFTNHNHHDIGKPDSAKDTCIEQPRKHPITVATIPNHLDCGELLVNGTHMIRDGESFHNNHQETNHCMHISAEVDANTNHLKSINHHHISSPNYATLFKSDCEYMSHKPCDTNIELSFKPYHSELTISEVTVAHPRHVNVELEPIFNSKFHIDFNTEETEKLRKKDVFDQFKKAGKDKSLFTERSPPVEEVKKKAPKKIQHAQERTIEFQEAISENLENQFEKTEQLKTKSTKSKGKDSSSTDFKTRASKPAVYTPEMTILQPTEITTDIKTKEPIGVKSGRRFVGDELTLVTPIETVKIASISYPSRREVLPFQFVAEEKSVVMPTETTEGLFTSFHRPQKLQLSEYPGQQFVTARAKEEKPQILETKQQKLFHADTEQTKIHIEEVEERESRVPKSQYITAVPTNVQELGIITPLESTDEITCQVLPSMKHRASVQHEAEELAFVAPAEETEQFFETPIGSQQTSIEAHKAEELEILEPAELILGLQPGPTARKASAQFTAEELEVAELTEVSAHLTSKRPEAQEHARVKAEEFDIVETTEVAKELPTSLSSKQEKAKLTIGSESVERLSTDESKPMRRMSSVAAEEIVVTASSEFAENISIELPLHKIKDQHVTAEPVMMAAPIEMVGSQSSAHMEKEIAKKHKSVMADERAVVTPVEFVEGMEKQKSTSLEHLKMQAEELVVVAPTEITEDISLTSEAQKIKPKAEPRQSVQLEVAALSEFVESLPTAELSESAHPQKTDFCQELELTIPSEEAESITVASGEKQKRGSLKSIPSELGLIVPTEVTESVCYDQKPEAAKVRQSATGDELTIVTPFETVEGISVSQELGQACAHQTLTSEYKLTVPSEVAELQDGALPGTMKVRQAVTGQELVVVIPSESAADMGISVESKKLTPAEATPAEMKLVTPSEYVEGIHDAKHQATKLQKTETSKELVVVTPSEVTRDIQISGAETEKVESSETTSEELSLVMSSETAEGLQTELNTTKAGAQQHGEEMLLVIPIEMSSIKAPPYVEQIEAVQRDDEEVFEMAAPLPRVIVYEGKRTPSEEIAVEQLSVQSSVVPEVHVEDVSKSLEFEVDLEDPEVEKAVVKIQSAFRGFNVRAKSIQAPKFTRQLSDHEIIEGTTIQLECHVQGIPTPDIEWMKNGVAITESNKHYVFAEDKEKCVLVIHNVTGEDDGTYICKATNKAGTATTAAELVIEGSASSEYETAPSAEESVPSQDSSVEEYVRALSMPVPLVQIGVEEVTPPELTMKLQSLVVEKRKTAKFMCGVTGIPKPVVTWFFGGKKLINEGRYRIYRDVDIYTLEIADCNDDDIGEYIITASNAEGQVYCAGDLMVESSNTENRASYIPPTFVLPLNNVTVIEKNAARFDCQVAANPEPEIIWFHNGIGIHEGDNYIMETTDEGVCSLIVVSANKTHAGEYSCFASNTAGRSSCSCMLTVQGSKETSTKERDTETSETPGRLVPEQVPPEFTEKPKKESRVIVGKTARISCTVKGSPRPSVVWFKNGNPLRLDSHYQLHLIGSTRTLLIPKTIYKDAGEYTCAATNASGAVYCSTVLYIEDPESTSSTDEGDFSLSETELGPPCEPLATIAELSEEQSGDEFIRPIVLPVVRSSSEDAVKEQLLVKLEELVAERGVQISEEIIEPAIPSPAAIPCKIQEHSLPTVISTVPTVVPISPTLGPALPDESPQAPAIPTLALPDQAPKFIKTIESIEVSQGNPARFESMISGTPDTQVQWFRNQDELEHNGHYEIDKPEGRFVLIVNNVNSDDEGRYFCKATNSHGQASCSAVLRVEGMSSSATDSEHSTTTSDARTSDDDKDKRVKLKSIPIIQEEQFGVYKVTSEYMDESGRLKLKPGDMVEVLDSAVPDRWFVRHKKELKMIGYIPSSLLQKQPIMEKSATEILQEKLAEVGDDVPASPEALEKPKAPFRRASFNRESGSDSSEAEDSKISPESFDIYMAVADYTPDTAETEDIPLVEGQYVDVLDSNSATKWLVRTKPTKLHAPKQGWVRASYLEKKTHKQYERKERPKSREIPDFEVELEFSRMERVDSKELEAIKKRGYVLEELLATERQFVKDLQFAADNYSKAVDSPSFPSSLQGKKESLFMNIEEILDFHRDYFVHELENCNNDAASVGRTFIKWQHKFEMYVQYCKNKQKSEALLSSQVAKNFFEDIGRALGGDKQLSLSDYLIKPVQRITKYQLLLKEIVKYTARAKQDCADLELALNVMMQVPKRANDLMHISLIEGYQGNLDDLGRLLRMDQFIVWDGRPKGKGSKGKDRQLFLFHDLIIFTKIKKESKVESPGYICKNHMMLPGIGMTDEMSDDRRFELWYGKPTSSSLVTLQAKTIYVKQAWVKEIRDILSKTQQELLDIKASAERKYGKSTDSVSSGSEASFTGKPSPIPLRKFAALLGRSESTSSVATTLATSSPPPSSPPSNVQSPGFPAPPVETITVGDAYEVTSEVIAEGGDEVVLSKGEVVKVIARGGSNMYKIMTRPTDNLPNGQQGYVSDRYLCVIKPEPKPVIEQPKLTEKPKSCTVMAGQEAKFSCKYKGFPKPEIEWFIQESVLLENRMEISSIDGSSILTVYDVKVEDAGKYKCVVENSAGCATGAANLHVQAPPTFIKPLSNLTGTEGVTVQLKCVLIASPEPDITWYKDGNVIIEGDKYVAEFDSEGVATLTITDVQVYDYGEYTCKAANLIAEASTSAKLSELQEPVFQFPAEEEHVLDVNDFYDIKHQLARGQFCKVHLCTDSISQSEFVAKFISYDDVKKEDACRELQIMKNLLHPSLVHHYESFESMHEMVIVMEYVPYGLLFEQVISEDMDLCEKQCAFYIKQICRAVDYMHYQKIVHLDIQPENLICSEPLIVKLIDFGNSRYIGDSFTELKVSPQFISPEVASCNNITPKADFWSIGVIAYALLSGISPFQGKTVRETFENVLAARWNFDEAFEELSTSCKDFISHLLCADPSKRSNGAKCLRHPWLSSRNEEITIHLLDRDRLKQFVERRLKVE